MIMIKQHSLCLAACWPIFLLGSAALGCEYTSMSGSQKLPPELHTKYTDERAIYTDERAIFSKTTMTHIVLQLNLIRSEFDSDDEHFSSLRDLARFMEESDVNELYFDYKDPSGCSYFSLDENGKKINQKYIIYDKKDCSKRKQTILLILKKYLDICDKTTSSDATFNSYGGTHSALSRNSAPSRVESFMYEEGIQASDLSEPVRKFVLGY